MYLTVHVCQQQADSNLSNETLIECMFEYIKIVGHWNIGISHTFYDYQTWAQILNEGNFSEARFHVCLYAFTSVYAVVHEKVNDTNSENHKLKSLQSRLVQMRNLICTQHR